MKAKKKENLSIEQLVSNAKKVLKGRLQSTNTATFDAALKKATLIKQRGSK